MTPNSSDLEPSLQALEKELQNLQPRDASAALIDEVTSMLRETKCKDHQALEATLMSLRPAAAPASLIARIGALLRNDPSITLTESSDKVISMPNWRDFTPILRVAAVIAACLGIFAMWKNPPTPDDIAIKSEAPSNLQGSSQGPALGSLQPVSADGAILERDGVIQHDGRFHERLLLRDSKRYRDANLEIEDEVIWQGNAASPLDAM